MKNKLAVLFLFSVYVLAMTKPYVPFIKYYANYEYFSKVLCINRDKPKLKCNGKCQLTKELKKSNNQNLDTNTTIPSINIDDIPISTINQFSYEFISFKFLLYKIIHIDDLYYKNFSKDLLKPPQLS